MVYQPDKLTKIETFFTQSEGCEDIIDSCFIGIIPDQSEQNTVYERLYQSPFIGDFRMAQVEFGVRQMFWQWNGQQPDFLVGEGYISLIGEQAESIELETSLKLGDIILTFGNTNIVTVTPFNIVLYYPELGLFVRTVPHCNTIWYSTVSIEYRETPIILSNNQTLTTAIENYCRHR